MSNGLFDQGRGEGGLPKPTLLPLLFHFSTMAGFFIGLIFYREDLAYIDMSIISALAASVLLSLALKIYKTITLKDPNKYLWAVVVTLVLFSSSFYMGTAFHRI